MQHLDEGTIHAWLDGALTADEVARVQQHTSECRECAANVAEARGLVAGASRILSALDDVAGAVPGRAAGAAATIESIEARRQAKRRRFWSRPAAMAAAASVIVMAGIGVVWREGARPESPATAGNVAVSVPTAEEAASAAVPVSAQQFGAQLDSSRAAGAVTGNAGRAVAGRPRRAADGAARDAARQTTPGPAAQRAPAAGGAVGQTEAKEVASVPPAPAPAVSLDQARKEATPSVTMLHAEPDAATSADTAPAARRAAARRAVAPSAAAARSRSEGAIPTTGAEVPQRTGVRVDTVYRSRVDTVIAPRPGPPELRGAGRAGAATRPFTATGCYEVVEGKLPRFITLTANPIWSGAAEQRFAATAPGAIGYWSQPKSGDVHLVIARMWATARIDASTGELRGTAQRGDGKRERFVARRGCK